MYPSKSFHSYYSYFKLIVMFSFNRMNVPVGEPRVQRLQPATVNVVEAAHVVKNIL